MSTRSYKEIALIACAGGLVGAAITKYLCSPPKQAHGDTSVTLLTKAASKNYYIGVDIGGTTISIMVLDKCGMECSHLMRNIDDPSESGVVRLVTSMVKDALSTSAPSVSLSDVAAIGVGSPGVNDLPNGIIRKASNFPDWNDFVLLLPSARSWTTFQFIWKTMQTQLCWPKCGSVLGKAVAT